MRLNVSVDISGALRKLDLARKEVQRASIDALNRTAEQARTAAIRDITGAFNLQSGFVRDQIEVRKASFRGDRLEALLIVRKRNRSLNLIRFVERRVTLAQYRKRKATETLGVYVGVKKGEGKTLLKGAFIGNQGRTVFQRVGKERLPIEPLQAIGVGQAMISEIGRRKIEQAVRDTFPANLRNQLKRRGVTQ
jgi:hypothetical protein